MGTKVNLKSSRTGQEHEVVLFKKDDSLVVRHTSLDQTYWSLPDHLRPKTEYRDMTIHPGMPPEYAQECHMFLDDAEGNRVFDASFVGELTFEELRGASQITRKFPLTICRNRAFDRAFIRFMQFSLELDGFTGAMLYSTEEVPESMCTELKLSERSVSTEDASESIEVQSVTYLPSHGCYAVATTAGAFYKYPGGWSSNLDINQFNMDDIYAKAVRVLGSIF